MRNEKLVKKVYELRNKHLKTRTGVPSTYCDKRKNGVRVKILLLGGICFDNIDSFMKEVEELGLEAVYIESKRCGGFRPWTLPGIGVYIPNKTTKKSK